MKCHVQTAARAALSSTVRLDVDADRPCSHLAPAVAPLLAAGAEFTVVYPAHGDVRFVHALSKGPADPLARSLASAHGVEYWMNDDLHYERDAHLLATVASWPWCGVKPTR
jgi:hypothetical protein